VSVNLLSLADVPGGKPEWASAPITALLTLWDRQEFSAGRESIVRAVVKNLQLLDLHLQVRRLMVCAVVHLLLILLLFLFVFIRSI
jgi:hypothetical protein